MRKRDPAANAYLRSLARSESSAFASQVIARPRYRAYARLWAECGLTAESRDLLFTLHALAEDQYKVVFTYKELYPHLFKCDGSEIDEDGELISTARQRMRRRFENLQEDQTRCGLTLASIKPGYKDEEGRHPSHAQLHAVKYLDEILEKAEADPLYGRGKKAAVGRAIVKFIKSSSGIKSNPKQRKLTPNPRKQIKDGWKRMAGSFNANVERMRQQEYEDWAIWQDAAKHLPNDFIHFIKASPFDTYNGRQETQAGDVPPCVPIAAIVIPSNVNHEVSNPALDREVSNEIKGIKIDTFKSPQIIESTTYPSAENPNFNNYDAALMSSLMLDAFLSVGALSCDLTKTDEASEKVDFIPGVGVDSLKTTVTTLLDNCERKHLNLIIRPRLESTKLRLVQLDDLNESHVEQVEKYAALIHETSPGNFQAWLAVKGADDEVVRRLKMGIGADMGASGATRIAGSRNFKQMYAPDYPLVRVRQVKPGLIVSIDDLNSSYLLAPATAKSEFIHYPTIPYIRPLKPLPDYDKFLAGAHLKPDGNIDRSGVDFAWAATAIKLGYSPDEVARELDRVSLKAASLRGQVRGAYIKQTVRAAARGI